MEQAVYRNYLKFHQQEVSLKHISMFRVTCQRAFKRTGSELIARLLDKAEGAERYLRSQKLTSSLIELDPGLMAEINSKLKTQSAKPQATKKQSKPKKIKAQVKTNPKKVDRKAKAPKVKKEEPVTSMQPRLDGVFSGADIMNEKYELIKLSAKWKELIGEACHPTSIMFTGEGGLGKSGITLDLIECIVNLNNWNALYVSREQVGTPTFQRLLEDTGVDLEHPRINYARAIDLSNPQRNPKNYQLVVFDSKDAIGMTLADWVKMKEDYPNTTFILLSQSNKDGSYAGAGKWRNEVDTWLDVYELGMVKTFPKNRWSQFGDVKIF